MTKQKPVLYSAIQPSGDVHLGNYLGAIRNWVELQNSGEYDCYFFVADLHSITQDYDPAEKQHQVHKTLVELIATGLDPQKSTLAVQSHIPETTELAWYFNCVTPMSELERMTQFKDKAARQAKNINVGLFDYPVLQTADVMLFKGQGVPVGQDQVQHVELMRDTARWFKKKFGAEVFPEPKPILTKIPKVMSLAEPTKKMSKSLGEKHYIALSDEPDVILKKLKKAVTDAEGEANLKSLLAEFANEETNQKFSSGEVRFSELKVELAAAIGDYFADFRAKRAELLNDPGKVAEMISESTKRAQAKAQQTIEEVRAVVGVR